LPELHVLLNHPHAIEAEQPGVPDTGRHRSLAAFLLEHQAFRQRLAAGHLQQGLSGGR